MKKFKQMNRNGTRRAIVMAIIIGLLVFATVGGTLAYLYLSTESIVNTFTPSQVTTAVVEDEYGVKIANTNNTDAYIRAAVVITWQNEDGDVYINAPVEGVDYSINFIGLESNGGWIKGSDGYYYHENFVDAVPEDGDPYTTSALFTDFEQISDAPADGFHINIEVLGSGIQNTPTYVVEEEWGVTLDQGVIAGK